MQPRTGAADVLRDARAAVLAQRRAQADLLDAALRWALLNPSSDGTQGAPDAAVHTEDGGCEPIAGPGCPGVSEYAVPELAAALGVGSAVAKSLVGDALELSHRLPRLWQRVVELDVDVAAARAVAAATTSAQPGLTAEGADWVDQKVAPLVGRMTPDQVAEVLDEAFAQFGLAVEGADEPRAALTGVEVVALEEPYTGLARLVGVLDLADALDLEQTLAAGARDLAALGAQAPQAALRAAALGHLARRQTALELGGGAARRVDLTLHFPAAWDADTGTALISPTGRLGEHERVLLEQVRGWVAASDTEVHVHPAVTSAAASGGVPGGVACGFPWCGSGVAVPGTVCPEHERALESGWTVESLGPEAELWTSPSGSRFRRDARGTVTVASSAGEPPASPLSD